MARVFVAIPVSERVKDALASIPREGAEALRWVRKEHYHITLRFLGDIPDSQVAEVGDAVQEAATGQELIRLTAKGVGAFPNAERARVIWAGIAGETEALRSIQRRIEEALARRGFPAEARRFRPHITVARSRGEQRLPQALRDYAGHTFGHWDADCIHVMESRLLPSGPRYTIRHTIPLGGSR